MMHMYNNQKILSIHKGGQLKAHLSLNFRPSQFTTINYLTQLQDLHVPLYLCIQSQNIVSKYLLATPNTVTNMLLCSNSYPDVTH